jgi:hypothetical protein
MADSGEDRLEHRGEYLNALRLAARGEWAQAAAAVQPLADQGDQNVVGEQAGTAVRSIEDANLVATLNPQPADRSLCTVKDQSETGEVEEGTKVTLHVTCQLVVPDVTDQTAAQAKAAMRTADVSMNFEGGSPRDEAMCTVVHKPKSEKFPQKRT